MQRTRIGELKEKIGSEALIQGFVDIRRDHGKLIFIDLRDRKGIVQLVFVPKSPEVYKLAETLRPEWVIKVTGTVKIVVIRGITD